MANRKKLMKKKNEFRELHFEESIYLKVTVPCTKNKNLFYKCHQLKNAKRIHAC